MIEIVLSVAVVIQGVALFLLRRKVDRRSRDLLKINAATLQAVTHVINASGEQAKINQAQHDLNQLIGHNLEVLGVHTRLIKPSVGFEAEQFLSWYNKKKEGNNGEI